MWTPTKSWTCGQSASTCRHKSDCAGQLDSLLQSVLQEILSRDSVTVSVDAVVYYRVSNPTMATNNVEDFRHSTHLLAATTLRNVLGTKCLAEVTL